MRIILVGALVLLFTSSPLEHHAPRDSFGGDVSRPCLATTGFFHVENASKQWRLCTPEGHEFFLLGVDAVMPPEPGAGKPAGPPGGIERKYGDASALWAEATAERLEYWGFNAVGTYSSHYMEPTYLDDRYPSDEYGLHSHATKMPFITIIRPAYYAMKNSRTYLPEPVKNLMYATSSYYRGYVPVHGVADYYDSKLDDWLSADLAKETYWDELEKSRYQKYLIGIACEDGDELYGFGAGDRFPTIPSAGYNNPQLAWIIATLSPTLSADRGRQRVFADTVVHTKRGWRDYLKAKYGTIANLNAAWGSDYTTFDSSGTGIANELVATGDGKTTTFHHTFAHRLPSRFSIQLLVNAKLVAGDAKADSAATSEGRIFGQGITGEVDYVNGTVALTFTTPPVRGSRITASYTQNGWGIGSGLLDENGRPEHQKWLGADFKSLSDSHPAVRSDLNSFLEAVSGHFFATCRDGIKSAFPNILYLGADTLGSYGVPPRPEVLESAARYTDVLLLAGSGGFPREVLDYIERYSGNKPIIEVNFRAANPDSELNSYAMDSSIQGFSTQRARGSDYARSVNFVRTATSSSGSRPYLGLLWWQYADNWDERVNWGLVSGLDNAYDGREDVREAVNCSAPLRNLSCGGETANYGDLISTIQAANFGSSQPSSNLSFLAQALLSLVGLTVIVALIHATLSHK